MTELVNHIVNISSPLSCRTPSSNSFEKSDSNTGKDLPKSSSKYILENNKILFERYDRYGKLISRVPWSANSINEKA